MKNLLARQLRRSFGGDAPQSPEFHAFLKSVEETYCAFEDDRILSERSMSIASAELVERNHKLQESIKSLKAISDELREQTLVSETLLRIGKAIAAELTLQRVARCVAEELAKAIGATWGAFCFGNSDDESLRVQPPVTCGAVPMDAAYAGYPIPTDLFSLVADFSGIVKLDTANSTPAHAQSLMSAPVMSRNSKRLGTLLFGSDLPNAFDARHECLLLGVAAQAAIAIDNARLYQAAKDAGDRLAYQAHHDSLTGLPNRVLFRDRLDRCIERMKRRSDYHFAVLFVDLDRFKAVNDTIGHAAGDQLLVLVSERLRTSLRSVDTVCQAGIENTVARMGGDEFTILLDDLAEPDHVNVVAQRVVDVINQPFTVMGQEVTISASVGVCHSDGAATTPEEFVRNADAAMYWAKTEGKSRYMVFSASARNEAMERLRIEQDLAYAIDRNEISVLYQPILSLSDRDCVGFEALIRWERAGVCIMPDEFIPVAEHTGAILSIGKWVLNEAVRELASWRTGNPSIEDLAVSVNVSSRQLKDPQLVAYTKEVLARHQLPAKNLKLEITESMMMEDKDRCIEVIAELRSLGIGIHLDDFGTGYSSLSYLHTFPLDGLKIDRSFIHGIAGRRDCIAVLQAIMTLAHNLDIKVVAEGLEQPEQVALMQVLDCDYGQGFLFARPLLPGDAKEFARTSLQLVRTA